MFLPWWEEKKSRLFSLLYSIFYSIFLVSALSYICNAMQKCFPPTKNQTHTHTLSIYWISTQNQLINILNEKKRKKPKRNNIINNNLANFVYNGFNIDLTEVPSGVLIRDLFSMLFYIFLSSSGPEPPDAAPWAHAAYAADAETGHGHWTPWNSHRWEYA